MPDETAEVLKHAYVKDERGYLTVYYAPRLREQVLADAALTGQQ
jgi:hypothetical protein